jgi:hypothetical protein
VSVSIQTGVIVKSEFKMLPIIRVATKDKESLDLEGAGANPPQRLRNAGIDHIQP